MLSNATTWLKLLFPGKRKQGSQSSSASVGHKRERAVSTLLLTWQLRGGAREGGSMLELWWCSMGPYKRKEIDELSSEQCPETWLPHFLSKAPCPGWVKIMSSEDRNAQALRELGNQKQKETSPLPHPHLSSLVDKPNESLLFLKVLCD